MIFTYELEEWESSDSALWHYRERVHSLLRTSSYDHETREYLLNSCQVMDFPELQELIKRLYFNQLDPVTQLDNYSKTQAILAAKNHR